MSPTPEPERATTPDPVSEPRQLLATDCVKAVVDSCDGRPDTVRAGTGGHTHVSSLVDVCVRQHVITRQLGARSDRRWTGGHRIAFALGRPCMRFLNNMIPVSFSYDYVLRPCANFVKSQDAHLE